MCVRARVCVCACMCVCVCVCVCVRACVCVCHSCICTHTRVHLCTLLRQCKTYTYFNSFRFSGIDFQYSVVVLGMESHCFDVIKDIEQVSLDCVGVTGLAQDLQQSCIRHKEESWKDKPLLFEVTTQRFLAKFQLFQQVRKELSKGLVSHAALNYIGNFMCSCHDLLPGLVNVTEAFCLLQ